MPQNTDDADRGDVQRVLAGEVDAFEHIVTRWQRPLVNLAYRFCRHRGQAEEMAQEAFLRAFRFLHQWREDAAFSTWLFALATNVYRSHLRRMRPVEVPYEEFRAGTASPDPSGEFAKREEEETVRRSVCTLPPRYRDAVVLFYFMEQNVQRAAECLGVPEGTFKARLHRGRALLRKRLATSLGRPGREST